MEKLKQHLVELDTFQIWELGRICISNSEYCSEQGIERYEPEKRGSLWFLANQGDWHEDAPSPLRFKSQEVLKAFQYITENRLFVNSNQGKEKLWGSLGQRRKDLFNKFSEDEVRELRKHERGYGNPIFGALPILDLYTLSTSGTTSIQLLGMAILLHLERFTSPAVAEYLLCAIQSKMLPGVAYDDVGEVEHAENEEAAYPDWLDVDWESMKK